MTAARTIPDRVRGVQIDAANPEVSAFVSANAGSGKTYVLAQRVINLLLRGVDPAKILCITFTKTAAANMANEVFRRLAAWTALDDAALDEQIRLSTGKTPSTGERARARRLFASALETPGGLKVQTIHAFCTRLLHQFPFEANVAARFTVLDEPSTAQLLERLILEVMLQAAAEPDSVLGKALATAIVVAADITFKEVIGDAIKARDAIEKWVERAGGIDKAIEDLSSSFEIDPSDSEEEICRQCESVGIPSREWGSSPSFLPIRSAMTNIKPRDGKVLPSSAGQVPSMITFPCSFETKTAPRKVMHISWVRNLEKNIQLYGKSLTPSAHELSPAINDCAACGPASGRAHSSPSPKR